MVFWCHGTGTKERLVGTADEETAAFECVNYYLKAALPGDVDDVEASLEYPAGNLLQAHLRMPVVLGEHNFPKEKVFQLLLRHVFILNKGHNFTSVLFALGLQAYASNQHIILEISITVNVNAKIPGGLLRP